MTNIIMCSLDGLHDGNGHAIKVQVNLNPKTNVRCTIKRHLF